MRVANSRLGRFLDNACIEMGYCLDPKDRSWIEENPGVDERELAERVMKADGVDPVLYPDHLAGLIEFATKFDIFGHNAVATAIFLKNTH